MGSVWYVCRCEVTVESAVRNSEELNWAEVLGGSIGRNQ